MPNTAALPEAPQERSPTDIRLHLLENGYFPLPIGQGKRPPMRGWPSIRATPADITSWEHEFATSKSTGVLTADVIAIDIDALDPTTCERLIERLYEIPDAGLAPCRTGQAPKCLFVFRAESALTKKETKEYLVRGHKCQVEILASGQQFVAYGIHDVTGQAYSWSGGDLLSIPFADLPEITPEAI